MQGLLIVLFSLMFCCISSTAQDKTPPGIDRIPEYRVEFPYSPADGSVWDANPKSFTFLAPTDWEPGKYTYTLQ